jgi:hypothetical protein
LSSEEKNTRIRSDAACRIAALPDSHGSYPPALGRYPFTPPLRWRHAPARPGRKPHSGVSDRR